MRRTFWLLFVLCLSSHAADALTLRWDPDLLALAPGESGTLSIVVDEAISVRTIDVVIEGDPTLLTQMRATPGALYDGVGCFVWEESEELEPGRWHGFAVTIGSDCWVDGPGELLRWDFIAGAEGGTLVPAVEITLYAPDGSLMDDVSLGYAVVLVSSVTGVEAPPQAPSLEVAPNPFNPSTTVLFTMPEAGAARLEVYDLEGRRVARPFTGFLESGECAVSWRGVDDSGRDLPSGCYLFKLETPGRAPVTAKAGLLR